MLHRVKVSQVLREPKKVPVRLYYRRVDRIVWDPHKFQWPLGDKNIQLMEYSVKMGCELLKRKHQIHNPVTRKWNGVLPDDYQLKWKTVWLKDRTRKETCLLWLIWHRVVAVNYWRGQIDGTVGIRCLVCPRRSEESVLHRFWECLSAQRVWQWAIRIMNALLEGHNAQGPWRLLSWRQGIFSKGSLRSSTLSRDCSLKSVRLCCGPYRSNVMMLSSTTRCGSRPSFCNTSGTVLLIMVVLSGIALG